MATYELPQRRFIGSSIPVIDKDNLTVAMQAYLTYHPYALQMQMFDWIMSAQAKEAELDAMLAKELTRAENNLDKIRASRMTGDGGGGGGGRRGGGAGGAPGGVAGAIASIAGTEATRRTDNADRIFKIEEYVDEKFSVPSGLEAINNGIDNLLVQTGKIASFDQLLEQLVLSFHEDLVRSGGLASADADQRDAAAIDLLEKVASTHREWIQNPDGTFNANYARLVRTIDRAYNSNLNQAQLDGKTPRVWFEERKNEAKNRLSKSSGVGPGIAEEQGRDALLSILSESIKASNPKATEAEVASMAETDSNLLMKLIDSVDAGKDVYDAFINTDEGKKAKDIYNRIRSGKSIPPALADYFPVGGLAAMFDQTGKRATVEDVTKPQAGPSGSPGTLRNAASEYLRSQGLDPNLPQIDPSILAKIKERDPLAAEMMPYAFARVQEEPEKLTPRTPAEKTVEDLLAVGTVPNFQYMAQQIRKQYPNDPTAQREAFAYFGARQFIDQQQSRTTNPNPMQFVFGAKGKLPPIAGAQPPAPPAPPAPAGPPEPAPVPGPPGGAPPPAPGEDGLSDARDRNRFSFGGFGGFDFGFDRNRRNKVNFGPNIVGGTVPPMPGVPRPENPYTPRDIFLQNAAPQAAMPAPMMAPQPVGFYVDPASRIATPLSAADVGVSPTAMQATLVPTYNPNYYAPIPPVVAPAPVPRMGYDLTTLKELQDELVRRKAFEDLLSPVSVPPNYGVR